MTVRATCMSCRSFLHFNVTRVCVALWNRSRLTCLKVQLWSTEAWTCHDRQGQCRCAQKQNQWNEGIKERCEFILQKVLQHCGWKAAALRQSMDLRVQGMYSALRSLCNRPYACVWHLTFKVETAPENTEECCGSLSLCSVHAQVCQVVFWRGNRKSALTVFDLLTWFLYNICVFQEWRGRRYLDPMKQWC